MAQGTGTIDAVGRALGGFNFGVLIGAIADATVSGANTFAVFRARVAAATGLGVDEQNALDVMVLRALDQGNTLGILTDANLSGKTTVAQVQALFVAEDSRLYASYTASSPQ